MAHPGFAKRLPDGDGAAGFIAEAKRGEAFKAVAEIDKAHAGGKPRKSGGRSGNGEDGGNRTVEARSASKAPATHPQESACAR